MIKMGIIMLIVSMSAFWLGFSSKFFCFGESYIELLPLLFGIDHKKWQDQLLSLYAVHIHKFSYTAWDSVW